MLFQYKTATGEVSLGAELLTAVEMIRVGVARDKFIIRLFTSEEFGDRNFVDVTRSNEAEAEELYKSACAAMEKVRATEAE
jgi:hypothetical protein